MKLRTKLLLTTTAAGLLVLGISEWLSYQVTMESFESHLAEMSQRQSAPLTSVRSFGERKAALSQTLIWIHVGHAALAILALVVVLSLFWSRFILSPIRKILDHMNSMGRSVTCRELSLDREDEIGQLASELNRLRGKLATAMDHAATASELAALALIGQTLLRNITTARDQLAKSVEAIAKARKDASFPPDTAVASLDIVLERLSSLPQLFEEEFEKRLGERRRELRRAKAPGRMETVTGCGIPPLDRIA